MALLLGDVVASPAQPQQPPLAAGAGDRRARARIALKLADQLLDRLEVLNLKGQHEVPARLSPLVNALHSAAQQAGLYPTALDRDCGVLRLMDDVYDVEDELLPRCRVRPYPPNRPIADAATH